MLFDEKKIKSLQQKVKSADLFIVLFFLLIIGLIFRGHSFYNVRNFTSVLRLSAFIGIVALGESLVVLTKGIDISVGAVMGITSVLASLLLPVVGVFFSILIPLLLCLIIGTLNGLLIVRGRIPAIVVTLGVMWLLRGIAASLTNGQLVRIENEVFKSIALKNIFGFVPIFFIGMIVLSFMIFYLLRNYPIGRHIYAIGGDIETAYVSGVSVDIIRVGIYAVAAFLYGIAGILMSSYIRVGQAYMGQGYEFRAITAVVLGGITLSGGKGNVLKAVLGAIILTTVLSLITNFAISPYLQGLFEGGVLILAVWMSQYAKE